MYRYLVSFLGFQDPVLGLDSFFHYVLFKRENKLSALFLYYYYYYYYFYLDSSGGAADKIPDNVTFKVNIQYSYSFLSNRKLIYL